MVDSSRTLAVVVINLRPKLTMSMTPTPSRIMASSDQVNQPERLSDHRMPAPGRALGRPRPLTRQPASHGESQLSRLATGRTGHESPAP